MLPYVFCYIFLCVNAILYVRLGKTGKRVTFLLGCGMILYLICLRDVSIGADTLTYCEEFFSISRHSWQRALNHRWELGYVILNKLISYFVDEEQQFVYVFGLINLLPVFYLIKKKASLPAMSLVIFYVLFFKSAEYLYRQWLAVLVLFISYKFVIERKPFKFAICCLAAAMFHRTALLFLIIYPMQHIRITKLSLLVSVVIAAFCGITGPTWRVIFNYFTRLEVGEEMRGGVAMLIFLWLCVFLVYLFSKDSLERPEYKMFFTMLWFAAITQPVVFTFALWSRVLIYHRMALVFLLPKAFADLIYNKRNRTMAFPMEIVFYCLLCVLFYANGIHKAFIPFWAG